MTITSSTLIKIEPHERVWFEFRQMRIIFFIIYGVLVTFNVNTIN